jgi:hypothetical protein
MIYVKKNDGIEAVVMVSSARTLTESEQKFFDDWKGGMLAIVNSADEALDILKRCV